MTFFPTNVIVKVIVVLRCNIENAPRYKAWKSLATRWTLISPLVILRDYWVSNQSGSFRCTYWLAYASQQSVPVALSNAIPLSAFGGSHMLLPIMFVPIRCWWFWLWRHARQVLSTRASQFWGLGFKSGLRPSHVEFLFSRYASFLQCSKSMRMIHIKHSKVVLR